jgi:hypothetical protein
MYKSLVLGLMSSSLAAASYGYDTSSAAAYPTTSDCDEEYPSTSTVEYPVSYPTGGYESSSEYPVSYPTKSYPAESYPAESYPATSAEYPYTTSSAEYPYPTGYTTSTIYSETCETYTATGGNVYSTTKTYAVGTTICPIESGSYSTEAPYPTNYVTSTYEVTKIYTYGGKETTECYTTTTVCPETEAGSYPTGTAAPTYPVEKPTYAASQSSSPYPTYPAKGGNASSPYVTAGAASFGVSFAAVFAAVAALL